MAEKNNGLIMVVACQIQGYLQKQRPGVRDLAIPVVGGSQAFGIGFGVLRLARASGDRQALLNKDR